MNLTIVRPHDHYSHHLEIYDFVAWGISRNLGTCHELHKNHKFIALPRQLSRQDKIPVSIGLILCNKIISVLKIFSFVIFWHLSMRKVKVGRLVLCLLTYCWLSKFRVMLFVGTVLHCDSVDQILNGLTTVSWQCLGLECLHNVLSRLHQILIVLAHLVAWHFCLGICQCHRPVSW